MCFIHTANSAHAKGRVPKHSGTIFFKKKKLKFHFLEWRSHAARVTNSGECKNEFSYISADAIGSESSFLHPERWIHHTFVCTRLLSQSVPRESRTVLNDRLANFLFECVSKDSNGIKRPVKILSRISVGAISMVSVCLSVVCSSLSVQW